MKQKLYLALAFIMASFCSLQMQAERVAPTLPQGQTPQEGGCYWLYNVANELFIGERYAGSNTPTLALDGTDIYMTKVDEYWVLRKNSPEGLYLNSWSGDISRFSSDDTYIDDFDKFIMSANNGSYRMTTKYAEENFETEGFLGYNPEDKYIYFHRTEDVDWLFIDATEAAHYVAELKLYNALNAIDDKGYVLDYYESMYTNRATATTLEMTLAAEGLVQALDNAQYTGIFDPLNEYKMMLYYSGDLFYSSYYNTGFHDNDLYLTIYDEKSASLTAVVETDMDGDLFYTPTGGGEWVSMKVYIDDVLVRTINPQLLATLQSYNDRLFDKISAGKHIVRWVFTNTRKEENRYYPYDGVSIRKIGIAKTPLITVNLAEPGSLGTEVLYNVNHVRDVRNLKVIGNMNEEDAVRLSMMTNMMYLDLSEATLAELPAETFKYDNTPYLHDVVLPEGMKTIGKDAFSNSNAERIVMPSTVQSIGEGAFYSTLIKSINIPNATTSLGNGAFSQCYQLEDVNYSNALTYIPTSCFADNIFLANINIPEGVTEIGESAFSGCKYGDFQPVLPASLQTIGRYAFSYCQQMKEIALGDNVSRIGSNAFSACTSLEKAVVSQNIYYASSNYYGPAFGECNWPFMDCGSLKDLTMRSATLVKVDSRWPITSDEIRSKITLRVPQYLVNYYKLDPYWYNFGDIVGFSTADTKNWTVHADLTLDSHSRFEGEPNLELRNSKFKVVGDLPMTLDNFTTNADLDYYFSINYYSQIMSSCDNINITGNCYHNVNMNGGNWLCMTLPFDTKLGNIQSLSDDVLFSIRYYDGAERAENGVGASWKRISDSEYVIPAGTGFVIQSSADYNKSIIQFKSLENDSRNNVLNNKDFVKELELNTCIDKAHSGWNLVGNPYMTYYNIHKLNFTAPITVYDSYRDAYNAYSIADDDYALLPLQGFFVQCPNEEMQTICFPVSGKQFTDEITEQNASKARRAVEMQTRKLIDLTLSKGDIKDNTRIVFNEAASCEYEINCDASKFMSGNKKNIQLWTLDENGTAYAINERPLADGIVALGVTIPSSGSYTFAATRCQAEGIILHDKVTGKETDLTQDSYTFDASEGTFADRFEIRSTSSDVTGIVNVDNSGIEGAMTVYSADGRLVKKADKFFNVQSLPQGVYIINSNGVSKKVIIK